MTQVIHSPTLFHQPVMELQPSTECVELCDRQDLAIAVLDGSGQLTVHGEAIALTSGLLVLIPAQTPYRLQTQSGLVVFVNRCEPEAVPSCSAWLMTL
jgi:glyoxylate utilization-related uncharacterized protein